MLSLNIYLKYRIVSVIMGKELTAKEKERIKALRRQYPKHIRVNVIRSVSGGFVAEVEEFPGVVTQADTLSELIEMVNDAVSTMFEVPRKFLSFMPTYLPPVKLAQQIGIFPPSKREQELTLSRA